MNHFNKSILINRAYRGINELSDIPKAGITS